MYRENALVKAANAARFRMPPLLGLLAFMVLFILSDVLSKPLYTLFRLISEHWSGFVGQTAHLTLVYLVAPFLTLIILIFIWVKIIEKRPIASLGFFKTQMCSEYLKGFGLGVGLMFLYIVFAYFFDVIHPRNMTFNFLKPNIVLSVLVVLPGWVIQGASEEIMTRGWLFQTTSRNHVLTGILISSSIFGLLHLGNEGLNPIAMTNLMLYGLFAIVYALYRESLWGICGFHSAWNWSQGNLFGISVSGNSQLGGSLMVAGRTSGPGYLTGGAFGAEGSIIVTGILLFFTLYFIYKSYRKVHPKVY